MPDMSLVREKLLQIDQEEIFKICRRDVPNLLNTVQRMLRES